MHQKSSNKVNNIKILSDNWKLSGNCLIILICASIQVGWNCDIVHKNGSIILLNPTLHVVGLSIFEETSVLLELPTKQKLIK